MKIFVFIVVDEENTVMSAGRCAGKTASDVNAVWAAYYAAQAQPYTYPAAVQTGATLQSMTGGQPAAAAAQYATLSRAAVTPQPSMLSSPDLDCPMCHCAMAQAPSFDKYSRRPFEKKRK